MAAGATVWTEWEWALNPAIRRQSIRHLPEWEEAPGARWRWAKHGTRRRLEFGLRRADGGYTFADPGAVRVTPRRLAHWTQLLQVTEATTAARFTRSPKG